MKKLNLITLFALMSLLMACESKTINGRVVDLFGQPIEGVTVSIENTAFTTTTNADGRYELDYAPGVSMRVVWEKNLDKFYFQSMSEKLSITEKSNYPLSDKIMLTYPAYKDHYNPICYLGEKSHEELPKVLFEKNQLIGGEFKKVSRNARYIISTQAFNNAMFGGGFLQALPLKNGGLQSYWGIYKKIGTETHNNSASFDVISLSLGNYVTGDKIVFALFLSSTRLSGVFYGIELID